MRPIRADLHLHSTYSDGQFSPMELCRQAQTAGLTHAALCDHDTLVGLGPMQEASQGMDSGSGGKRQAVVWIPSIELSAGPDGQTHVLGYGADPANAELQGHLQAAKARRLERFREMLRKLGSLGVEVPAALLPQDLDRPLGRAHIARALIRMGAVNTMGQAFDRFLAEGKPAYVPYARLGALQAVDLLYRVGAVPVLAHPCRKRMEEQALFGLVTAMQEAGLQGLEVYHPSAAHRQVRSLEVFARKQNLLVTGGSDYHGDLGSWVALGKLPLGWPRQQEDVPALLTRMADRRHA